MHKFQTEEQRRQFYTSYLWKKLRKQIINRDNHECQECKRQGKVFINHGGMNKSGKRKKITLIVHHIKELIDHPELATTPSNLETLCVNCHNQLHDRYYRFQGFTPKENKYAHDEKW